MNCFERIIPPSYPQIWRHILSRDFHFPSIYLQLQRLDSKSHISKGRACFLALTHPGWGEWSDRLAAKTDQKGESGGEWSSWFGDVGHFLYSLLIPKSLNENSCFFLFNRKVHNVQLDRYEESSRRVFDSDHTPLLSFSHNNVVVSELPESHKDVSDQSFDNIWFYSTDNYF